MQNESVNSLLALCFLTNCFLLHGDFPITLSLTLNIYKAFHKCLITDEIQKNHIKYEDLEVEIALVVKIKVY
jgi:hypothetical protein